MKVYRIDIHDTQEGSLVFWARSKREADRRCAAEMQDGDEQGRTVSSIKAIDIPTDKAGLIQWLNTHLTTDNG